MEQQSEISSHLWGSSNNILDHYYVLNAISSGSYGVVLRAVDKQTGEIVAVKQEVHGMCRSTMTEVNILMTLPHHPNIVEFKQVFEDHIGDLVYVVMEYVETDLCRFIQVKREPLAVSEIKCVMRQILEGVKFLHENGVVHGDLKPANILFNTTRTEIKICDFGMSRQVEPATFGWCTTSKIGTLWYRAPELLNEREPYSSAIDMWSVGCIMGELVLREVLFQGRSEDEQRDLIYQMVDTPGDPLKHKLHHAASPPLTASGVDLLEGLLRYDPDRRITAEAALNHRWFKEYYGFSVL